MEIAKSEGNKIQLQERVVQAIKAHSSPPSRCVGLGNTLNKALHDFRLVDIYCQEFPAAPSMEPPAILNLDAVEQNTYRNYWEKSLRKESNS